jgi:hypothetical protein
MEKVGMVYPANVVSVLSASPSDVAAERDALRRTLWEFNDEHAAALQARLAEGTDWSDIEQFLDAEITGHFGMSRGQAETGSIAERLTAWAI